jgi:predicted lipid-binding transport protein (Tim44 family)
MKWLLGSCVLMLGAALALPEAEARRFGGGRNIGIQRNVQKAPPAATPAKPAQQQQQAAPAAGGSKWGPILGGLALGGMLAYLFSGNGLAGILLLALLAFAAVMAYRLLAQRRAPAAQRMQYAGLGSEVVAAPPPQASGRAPQQAGFDSAAFLRGAKTNFIKLQLANDARQMEEIREFTTDAMFEELSRERGAAGQRTEIEALDAELLEVATEGDQHWASVRFSGLVREAPGGEALGFSEVWHLAKPADGSSGWLLAGIQQMH